MSLIHLTNINKVFTLSDNLEFQALKNINLTIKAGEYVAIVGPSGSGKSTLMHILGLLDSFTTGKYELEGLDVARLSENKLANLRNQKIGFVFQQFNLLNRTRAVDNVALPLIYSGVSKNERVKRATKVLEQVGLLDKLQSRPNQLSGGQQQRVAIARALVTNPQVIFADEPTGNLDSKTGHEILKLLKDLNSEGRTVILITHDMEVAQHAERIITLKDGEIM